MSFDEHGLRDGATSVFRPPGLIAPGTISGASYETLGIRRTSGFGVSWPVAEFEQHQGFVRQLHK